MNLVLLEPHEVEPGNRARLVDGRAHHLLRVLGVGAGDRVRVGVVNGGLGEATVEGTDGSAVDLAWDDLPLPAAGPSVDLVLAVPRPKGLKRMFAPIASLGVRRLLLTQADRVERCYFDSHAVLESVYRPHLLEGLAQACRTRLPEVSVHRWLAALLEREVARGGALLVADVAGRELTGVPLRLPTSLARPEVRTAASERVLIAVGPEGGWSDQERARFADAGFHAVTLGPHPLRTDVAVIALLTLVNEALAS